MSPQRLPKTPPDTPPQPQHASVRSKYPGGNRVPDLRGKRTNLNPFAHCSRTPVPGRPTSPPLLPISAPRERLRTPGSRGFCPLERDPREGAEGKGPFAPNQWLSREVWTIPKLEVCK